MSNIKLGDLVKDKVTGYTGIATSKTEFLNGCVQIEITRKLKKGEVMKPEEIMGMGFDIGQVERVGPGINVQKKDTGGPMRRVPRRVY